MSGTLQGIRQGTDDEVMDIKHGETDIIKLGGYSMEKVTWRINRNKGRLLYQNFR